MTINRVKPGNWQLHDNLASSEANQLDTNITYAVDKRAGFGDTIGSALQLASGASIATLSGSQIFMNAGSTITLNGILAGTAASGTLGLGATATIAASVSGAKLTATTTGAKIITSGGGTFEIGDSTNFVNFTTPRTRVVQRPFSEQMGILDPTWICGANHYFPTSISNFTGVLLNMFMHNGATLSSVSVNFATSNTWSVVPSTFPSILIQRMAYNSTGVVDDLNTTAQQFYPTETLATWNNGAVKQLTYTATQNNVLDHSNYVYWIQCIDSSGGTATSKQNYWHSVTYNFSNITDTRWQ